MNFRLCISKSNFLYSYIIQNVTFLKDEPLSAKCTFLSKHYYAATKDERGNWTYYKN
jgi:hypothetical protein